MSYPVFLHRQPFSPSQKLLLVGLTALTFLLRLHRLGVQSLWFDESFSAFIASRPLDAAIQAMLEEGLQHTPLYYLLLRPFAAGVFNEFSLRFLSATLGLLAIPLIAQMGRITAHPQVGLLAAVLLTVNPFHVWYSQETRMYTLVIFAALGAMYFFSQNLQISHFSHWLGLAIFVAIGLNTHYFALFIPLIQFVFMVVTLKQNHRLLRPWGVAQFVAGVSFLPWIVVMLNWGQFYFGSAALQPPTGYDLLQTWWNFSLGYTAHLTSRVIIVLSLFGLLFLMGARVALRTGRGLLIVLWALTPPLLTFFMSFRLPMYVDRYISLSLPAFLLLIALGVYHLRPYLMRLALTCVVLGTMLSGLGQVYYDSSVYNRADWRNLGAYLEENIKPGDVIALWKYQTLLSLFFYYHGSLPLEPVIIGPQVVLPAIPAEATAHKLWLVLDYPNNSTHLAGHCQDFALEALRLPPTFTEWLEKNQPRLIEVKEFSCVRLQIYQ